jgi:hypothetical protein
MGNMGSNGHKLTVFYEVYTPEVLKTIAGGAKSDLGLRAIDSRLHPHNEYLAFDRVHLDKCLVFAKQHDALDQDRLSRLRQPKNFHMWQSVYNELLVPYFFARVFRLKIGFVTNPHEEGLGDFQVIHPEGQVIVEVKTPEGDDPNLQGPDDTVHAGYDDDLLKRVFLDGAGQLQRGKKNLIVICTQLCAWIHDSSPFEKLFYGQEVITGAFDPEVGRIVQRPRTEFVPDGELNKYRTKRFTRISAIASFRNEIYCGSPFSEEAQQVQFTLLHNYHALCPMSPNLFPDVEQFIPDRDRGSIEHVNEGKSAFLIEG